MFKQELKERYPFLTQYFEGGINHPSRKLSHSILLYGNDIQSQYELATEIARLLNCNELKNQNCHCTNCNWVRAKEHPSVLTISKIDNKPSDDESKTVISVKQSQMIKNSLLNTSDYHRVFIFCDAEIENGVWKPFGLKEINFQEETANSLLKIIEEPPENTTFFFLTRDKNDLISTIISRSQSFFVPSYKGEIQGYSLVEELLADYPNIERRQAFDLAEKIFAITKEHGASKIFSELQNYLQAMMKSNLINTQLKSKILKDLKTIETAKKQITAHVTAQLAVENMCLDLLTA